MNDPITAFLSALSDHSIPPPVQPVRVASKLERFTPKGDRQENGWYVLYPVDGAVVGCFGDWKRNIKEKFCSADRSTLTSQQWGKVSEAWRNAEEARRQEELIAQAEVVTKCKSLFAQPLVTTHPYLTNKRVQPHGKLVLSNSALCPGWLALPLIDESGVIHTAQFISGDSSKRFFYRGRKAGCWFDLNANPEGPLCIVEGYATGASVHEATGWATVCAMDAGNLLPVSKAIRKLHPARTILLCADNDQFTEDNPGVTKATAAAKAIQATVIYPQFSDESLIDKPTDFNDLANLSGQPEVKRQLVEGARLDGNWEMLVEDGCDTMSLVLPEPVQLIEGLLCEQAKLVIGGSSKSYKTWFTGDLSLSLCSGADFLGRKTIKSKVLYINLELKENTFRRRIQTIVSAKGIKLDYQQFFHLSLRGKISRLKPTEIVDRIVQMALARHCAVVVIDPIYKANTLGVDENDAGSQTVFYNELDRITTEAKCSLVFDDHFSKGNQAEKDPLDAIRGSSAKGGDVDAAIILRAHKEKGSFCVDVIHRELPPVEPFVLTWQFPLFLPDASLDHADMKQAKRGGRPKSIDPLVVLEAFEHTNSESGFSVSKLALEIGISRQTLSQRILPELRAKGFITTAGDGSSAFQYITQKGKNKLTNP